MSGYVVYKLDGCWFENAYIRIHESHAHCASIFSFLHSLFFFLFCSQELNYINWWKKTEKKRISFRWNTISAAFHSPHVSHNLQRQFMLLLALWTIESIILSRDLHCISLMTSSPRHWNGHWRVIANSIVVKRNCNVQVIYFFVFLHIHNWAFSHRATASCSVFVVIDPMHFSHVLLCIMRIALQWN